MPSSLQIKVLYRYTSYIQHGWDEKVILKLNQYPVLRETPCKYVITDPKSFFLNPRDKFVGKTHLRRFAYPTKEEAFNSFLKRKEHQIKILTSQLSSAKITLAFAIENPPK